MGTDMTILIPGTIFTFPLANGLHGACRVTRAPHGLETTNFADHMLVCATRWVGHRRLPRRCQEWSVPFSRKAGGSRSQGPFIENPTDEDYANAA